MVLAYFGPEMVMPVTSIIATVAVVVMMFGKTLLLLAVGLIRQLVRREKTSRATAGPHFWVRRRRNQEIGAGIPVLHPSRDNRHFHGDEPTAGRSRHRGGHDLEEGHRHRA